MDMAVIYRIGRRNALRAFALILLGGCWLLIGGCETLGYYSQAVLGQAGLLSRRQSVPVVVSELQRTSQSDAIARRRVAGLRASQEILEFAEVELALDTGNRYRSYVELTTPHVVWNVFAAPELDLQARSWCYPMIGCAPYRGYFSETRAERYANKLAARGFDVYLGGVAAYSTLGWFDDPLLSSFIDWPEANLAELLVHELAHGQVWVKGDVEFNEAFATFVGRRGATRWIEQRRGSAAVRDYLARRHEWRSMVEFLLGTRTALQRVYLSEKSDVDKRHEKEVVLARARACYESHKSGLGAGRYDSLMADINNAYLVSLATYQDNVPAFAALYAERPGDWTAFYAAVAELAGLNPEVRSARVAELREQQIAHAGDDQRAYQVQCEAFTSHGFDAEATGAEHDDVRRGSHG
jgi:predicted aminopeptidase